MILWAEQAEEVRLNRHEMRNEYDLTFRQTLEYFHAAAGKRDSFAERLKLSASLTYRCLE